MGRKLTWRDVYLSLPDHDKKYYTKIHKDMYDMSINGQVDEAKDIASKIEAWESKRWELAKSFRVANESVTKWELGK